MKGAGFGYHWAAPYERQGVFHRRIGDERTALDVRCGGAGCGETG